MEGEPPTQASTSAGAVFLSYASQDVAAAKRICEALRAARIEVWFDQSELRGGDAWDRSIRQQIRECQLFIPIISTNTDARREGYFRREWKLAVDRTHDMSERVAFLVPVVVDDTSDSRADVPDRFREVQWTRLPSGETPPAFVERIRGLIAPEVPATTRSISRTGSNSRSISRHTPSPWWSGRVLPVLGSIVVLGVLAFVAAGKLWLSKPTASPSVPVDTIGAFNPPPHSIAVLPFVNMSGDKDQEYFSDGLTEELLNSLSRINGLQVAARTSSFSFQGEHPDIATVAHKLNVASVLEGSVRRSEHTIRVTAQLNSALTGFHLWSQTYDRDPGDVLKLQTEIASAVAEALKVTLLGDISQKVELGGTRDPAAFDAYLRGRRIANGNFTAAEDQGEIAAYTEAIRLDPTYAMALAYRALARSSYASFYVPDPAVARQTLASALADARAAVNLAPELGEGYYALGVELKLSSFDFVGSSAAYERALALAPGNARVLAAYSRNAAELGHAAAAIDVGRRAITLDPLNPNVYRIVGISLRLVRQYVEARAALQSAISLQPNNVRYHALLGETQYAMGTYEAARRSCEAAATDQIGQVCLAKTYHKLGRNADAEDVLRKIESARSGEKAYTFASIYAQWGDVAKALDWLETAVRQRDLGLEQVKADPDLDPLRSESRFQAIERALKFPD